MTIVIFSKTLDRRNQVFPFIEKLSAKDPDLGILIFQGFQDLEEAPEETFPLGETEPYFVTRIRRGREVQVELVKRLSEPRIFEMKADQGREYHRFIYFPYIYRDEPAYVFVYGFTKIHGKPDLTNFYMRKAKELYDYLKRTNREEEFFEG
ncbi:hypothetical protein [Planococcus lenghuensis]|uniref:Uncharacterized protein n=1 Tax=Planococcus lenghuensis TaxID=2213202 RepID=A0A1Q2L599_9BACL|nr:hypothetical protein [Planococcus lenghuensis]AQQ55596.1 hypothetical protein B0X71_20705 [Planococcus lenghuensis]